MGSGWGRGPRLPRPQLVQIKPTWMEVGVGASNVISVPVTATGTVHTGDCTYFGFSYRETAGTSATITVRSGGASGDVIEEINLAASGAAGDYYGPQGIRVRDSMHVTISGTVSGCLRLG